MSRHLLIAFVAAIAVLAVRPALAADAKQMEENKKIIAAFYDAALNKKDFEEASKYLGSKYIQHNPVAADGPEGLKAFLAFLKDKFPNNRSDIKRIFADGDFVIVHVHAVRQGGRALGRDPADPREGRQQQRDVLAAGPLTTIRGCLAQERACGVGRSIRFGAVIDVAGSSDGSGGWNAPSKKKCRRSSSAMARPSAARASWR